MLLVWNMWIMLNNVHTDSTLRLVIQYTQDPCNVYIYILTVFDTKTDTLRQHGK